MMPLHFPMYLYFAYAFGWIFLYTFYILPCPCVYERGWSSPLCCFLNTIKKIADWQTEQHLLGDILLYLHDA